MKFKINNKNWQIKELSQEEMKEELKRHCETPIQERKVLWINLCRYTNNFLR